MSRTSRRSRNRDIVTDDVEVIIKKEDKIKFNIPKETSHYMTKHERAMILGTRAEQFDKQAPSMFTVAQILEIKKTNPYLTSLQLANLEFREGIIPLLIRRHLPDGTYEDWSIKEFITK